MFIAETTHREVSMKSRLLESLWLPCQTAGWGQEAAGRTRGHTVTDRDWWLQSVGGAHRGRECWQKGLKVCQFWDIPQSVTVVDLGPSPRIHTLSHFFTAPRLCLFFAEKTLVSQPSPPRVVPLNSIPSQLFCNFTSFLVLSLSLSISSHPSLISATSVLGAFGH